MPQPRDPEHYRVTVDRPPDFEEFWSALLAESAATPLRLTLDHVPMRSTDEVAVYEVRFDSLDGVRIAGWYCLPHETHLPPPYPGLVLVPGYISEPVLPKGWARKGYAALSVGPRGKLRSNATFNPGYPGLLVHNIVDRNTYGYRGFYIDAARAVDALLERAEVDHGRIGVHGSSQGGALAITTAALRSDVVSCGAAGAPYLCGFLNAARLTHSYPYEEINDYLHAHPHHEPLVRETLAYYDGINFAPMIRAPMLVYLGLEDDVCPPETGFAVYHAMRCPKELHANRGCAHDAGSYWMEAKVEDFLARHLAPARQAEGVAERKE